MADPGFCNGGIPPQGRPSAGLVAPGQTSPQAKIWARRADRAGPTRILGPVGPGRAGKNRTVHISNFRSIKQSWLVNPDNWDPKNFVRIKNILIKKTTITCKSRSWIWKFLSGSKIVGLKMSGLTPYSGNKYTIGRGFSPTLATQIHETSLQARRRGRHLSTNAAGT